MVWDHEKFDLLCGKYDVRNWYRITCDDENIYRDISHPDVPTISDSIKWNDIKKL